MRNAHILAAAVAIALCLRMPARAEGKVVILDYHSFLGHGTSNIDYSEKELGEQLDAMAALGYKFVSLDDALAGRVEGAANIVVTIDDGNHSIYSAYKNVFEPRGIKPYLFVYPAIILSHQRFAVPEGQLLEMRDSGCGIGAHGYHHNPVTDKAWAKNPKDFMTEITRPRPALERITGSVPTTFAYPFGVFAKRAEEEVAKAGYEWAFAADENIKQVDFSDSELDHYAVPRTITYRYNQKHLLRVLKKFLDYDGPPLFEDLPREPEDVPEGAVAK
jgi:Predicted xylanase/chitin deacetylase